jgi:hypothetical protein
MPNILHRVGIAAEPIRVFEVLTTVAGIRNWWSSETHGDASEGGAFQFRRNRLEVLHAEPSLVKWSYSGPAEDWVGTEIVGDLPAQLERPGREGRRPSGAHGHEDHGGRLKRIRKNQDKGVFEMTQARIGFNKVATLLAAAMTSSTQGAAQRHAIPPLA